MDIHLRAGMKFHTGKLTFQIGQDAQILDDHAIQPGFIVRRQKLIELVHFPFLHQGINGKIKPYIVKMAKINGFLQLILLGVIGIGSRSKSVSTHVDSICSCHDGTDHAFKGASRR